ncbi:Uracil DNA glycosylase superfamily protein [Hartmannibacter diazotrophicus]|uniref:Uracil DNA glycosylase superfamily protein n=1 Tax=Hartmannibacter diazotrophicus TaxID=1482074 RepID=A0A2C9D6F0_9HYPH|nr:uracil-DNA glycosylase family protein [Hartmannibacter diazotrophicus]SON55095.1 Uracil DNA glycosylase superfamily protein [Hartmannibacter diazotrophicus]
MGTVTRDGEETARQLVGEITACRLCRDEPRRLPGLPHEPRPVIRLSPTARLLVAGQAPGTRVHATGLPFNDASGDRLRSWMGIDRDTFYDRRRVSIAPMGFCFPGQDAKGGDLPPRPECAPQWRERVMAALPGIDLVVAIGLYAIRWHVGADAGKTLRDTVANWQALFERPGSPKVIVLPHPSWRNTHWLKANPWFERDVLPVLRREVRLRVEPEPDATLNKK